VTKLIVLPATGVVTLVEAGVWQNKTLALVIMFKMPLPVVQVSSDDLETTLHLFLWLI
jgi:hypothetical protein